MVAKPTGELFSVITKGKGMSCAEVQREPLKGNAFDEDWLQGMLERCPALLPVSEIDERVELPLHSLGREVPTDAGSIDNLFISRNGHLVIVETKLWRNPQARREAVAQILDYAKHARAWDYSTLSEVIGRDIVEIVKPKPKAKIGDWTDQVTENLRRGRITLLVVGDGIHTEAESLAEVVGGHPDFPFRLALVELRVYKHGTGEWLIVPSTLAKTVEIERAVVRIEYTEGSRPAVSVKTPVNEEAGRRRHILSEEKFSDILRGEVGDDAVRVTDRLLRLAGDSLDIVWDAASFTFKVPDPAGTGKKVSLFAFQDEGWIYITLSTTKRQLEACGYEQKAIKQIADGLVALSRKFGCKVTSTGKTYCCVSRPLAPSVAFSMARVVRGERWGNGELMGPIPCRAA